jgi:hypothetical protein
MIVRVQRVENYENYTLGLLYIDGKLEAFTLEDEKRDVKIMSKTRIPEGVYDARLQLAGKLHTKYKAKFSFHKGMIHLQGVPNFSGIMLHIGNTDRDTAGCILVGNAHKINRNFISESTQAYTRVYNRIAAALLAREKVQFLIVDELH